MSCRDVTYPNSSMYCSRCPFSGTLGPMLSSAPVKRLQTVSTSTPNQTALVDTFPTYHPYHRNRHCIDPYESRYVHPSTMRVQYRLYRETPTFMLPLARIYPNWSRTVPSSNTHRGCTIEYNMIIFYSKDTDAIVNDKSVERESEEEPQYSINTRVTINDSC